MTDVIHILSSYMPGLVLRRLAAHPTVPNDPTADRFPAAVLFADLSGFTPLAERLAQQGPAGAETLTQLLNHYFGLLIDLIAAHGGDVVEFEGDALLAIWPAAQEQVGAAQSQIGLLETASLRAAQCGLAIQAQLHNYPATDDVSLSLRVSVSAGVVAALHVGGVFGRWKLLVNGEPLTQVNALVRLAEPGQVVLSADTWRLLHQQGVAHLVAAPGTGDPNHPSLANPRLSGLRLEALRAAVPLQPLRLPTLTSEAETGLRAYLPGAIIARLIPGYETNDYSARPEWLADLRRVTVLFINIPDLDANTPLERLHQLVRTLQTTLYRYEGSFNKIGITAQGVTLVAATGLPPLAHEDDAVRGALAALSVLAELRRLGLRGFVGVTTGRAFCGIVGNATRREYTMIGDVVNLSARLMQAAATDTNSFMLTDALTYNLAQKRVNFETLPPILVKGKADWVEIYRPLNERLNPTTQTQVLKLKNQIIGRQAERLVMADQLQALLRGGHGGVVVFEGEAGIGKTRLIEELQRQVSTMHLKAFMLRGNPIERYTPYQVWRPVFSQLLDLEVLSDAEARRQHILNVLEMPGMEFLRLAPLLNVVLPLDLPDNELTGPMTGQSRADSTRALLIQILQTSVSASPKVIIVEDGHALDSASWTLLLAISHYVQPLLLVIALRSFSDLPPAEYAQLLRVPGVFHMRLEALSLPETQTLVCQRLEVTRVPDAVIELIWEKAGGNPFFSEELAYTLRDSSLITVVDGEGRLAAGAGNLRQLTFPDTVQGVITSRIDRLHPQQQLVLKMASVIGRTFSQRVLEAIYPMPADSVNVPGYLDVLEQLELLRLESATPDRTYIFKHAYTQEVAYNLMLFAQRRELHAQVGLAIETLFRDQISELQGVLATHFFRGELWDKAIDYLIRAGDTAVRLNAFAEAHQYYADAQDCLGHLPYTYANRRLYIDLILKETSISWGTKPLDLNLNRLAEAEGLAMALPGPNAEPGGGDRTRLAHIHFWMGRTYFYRNAPARALQAFRQVLTEMNAVKDSPLRLPISTAMAQALIVQGQFGKARQGLIPTVLLLERVNDLSEWIQTEGSLGMALTACGFYEKGLEAGHKALTRAKDKNDLPGMAASYINLCGIHLLGGDWLATIEAGQNAVQTAEQIGNPLYAYLGYGFKGWAEARLKLHSTAAESLRLAYTLAQGLGGKLLFDSWFRAAQAEMELQSGHPEDAISLAERIFEAATVNEETYACGLAQRIWAEALLAEDPLGQAPEVDEHFARSLQCFEAGEARLEMARTRMTWAKLQRARQRPAEALNLLEHAATQFRLSHLTSELSRANRWLTELRGELAQVT